MKRSIVCIVLAATVAATLAYAQGRQDVPGRMPVRDPSDPTRSRAVVSSEEREQLGLTDIKKCRLEGKLDTKIKEELDRKRSQAALPGMQFPEMCYVEVQFQRSPSGAPDSAANKKLVREGQEGVLGDLTAAEFHLWWRAERFPGFVGYVGQEGLEKLRQHRGVVAVVLDSKPIPERPPVIYRHMLDSSTEGMFGEESGVKEGQVEADVYRALAQSTDGYAWVVVTLKGSVLPEQAEENPEMARRSAARESRVRACQLEVLSSVTPLEFRVGVRSNRSLWFAGFVTRDGLKKLIAQQGVDRIGLDEVEQLPGAPKRTTP